MSVPWSDDLVAALGIDAGVSKSQVSRICAELDAAVAEFRERRLDHIGFPYVFLDATYVKAHEGAHVVSKAIVVATGVPSGHDTLRCVPQALARPARRNVHRMPGGRLPQAGRVQGLGGDGRLQRPAAPSPRP